MSQRKVVPAILKRIRSFDIPNTTLPARGSKDLPELPLYQELKHLITVFEVELLSQQEEWYSIEALVCGSNKVNFSIIAVIQYTSPSKDKQLGFGTLECIADTLVSHYSKRASP